MRPALLLDPLLPRPRQRRSVVYARVARAAGRAGMDCRVLTTGILDPERETSLDEMLATLELPARRFLAEQGTGRATEVIDLSVNGVRVTLMPTSSSRAERSPDPRESAIFVDLAEQVFDRFRPDVLLTYGGHPASLELMRRARQRGVAVVFHLHNFGYNDRRAFADVSTVMFPSEYSRRHHARLLNLDGPVTADPIPIDRIVADNPEPQYVTFVNPQLPKGVAVFDRTAIELNRRRPDIPLLIGVIPKLDPVFDLENRKPGLTLATKAQERRIAQT